MRVIACAALQSFSLLIVAAAQTVPTPPPSVQEPEAKKPPVRGPKLGSPAVYKPPDSSPRDGVKPPQLLKDVKASYTAAAMRAKATGVVKMEAVVLPDGTVGDVRVTQSVHPDLDGEAIAAVRKWTLKPGTVDGKVVPFQITVETAFTLRDRRSK